MRNDLIIANSEEPATDQPTPGGWQAWRPWLLLGAAAAGWWLVYSNLLPLAEWITFDLLGLSPTSEFGLALATQFLHYPPISEVAIDIEEAVWDRAEVAGQSLPANFVNSAVKRTMRLVASSSGVEIRSGISDLQLIKTSGSSFTGFLADTFTTLAPATSRLLQTNISMHWGYTRAGADYDSVWRQVRDVTMSTFAEHRSYSVQHSLFTIAEAILSCIDVVADVEIALPNQHCQVVDMSPFGLENRDEIFVPMAQPFGLITARISRSDLS